MRIISYRASPDPAFSTQNTYTWNIERNMEALKDAFKDCSFRLRYSLVASIRKVWWSFASAITHKWELSPPIVTLLPLSLSLSFCLAHGPNGEGGKGLTAGSTLRCHASPLVCGIDVAYTRIMVDKGEQWIENCFIFRFLIRASFSIMCLDYCTLARNEQVSFIPPKSWNVPLSVN